MSDDLIDFSSLDPAADPEAWAQRIAQTAEQARLCSHIDLSPLDPYASRHGASDMDQVVQRILDAAAEPVVVRLAPKALAMAAMVAAASWFLVWVDDGQRAPSADPALAAMSWSSRDEPLSLEQMGALTGGELSYEQ